MLKNSHTAAFINAIADEGTKAEAIEWLQNTWDELQNIRLALLKLGFWTDLNLKIMQKTGEYDGPTITVRTH